MDPSLERRDVLKGAALVSVAALAAEVGTRAFAEGGDTLKIGLIGCGSRGCGALEDCVKGSGQPGLKVWALGDAFAERARSLQATVRGAAWKDLAEVPDERVFAGLDAYRGVVDSGVDLVICATPPGFRPEHMRYAVEQGKHLFVEKPVAVDAPGVRLVLAAAEEAQRRRLAIVAGTQRRHQSAYRQTVEQIHGGFIGEVVAGTLHWNQGGAWARPRERAWSDVEWQLRDWPYFTWLSGDHIVEQHVHNIDVMLWCMRDRVPEYAYSLGGRQVRTASVFGHIYDHFATEFGFGGGERWMSLCRQQDRTEPSVDEYVIGTEGCGDPGGWLRRRDGREFHAPGGGLAAYQQEQADLIASIRAGRPLNEGQRIAQSTGVAIMARESAYTGQRVLWTDFMQSELTLMPPDPKLAAKLPEWAVPQPGRARQTRDDLLA